MPRVVWYMACCEVGWYGDVAEMETLLCPLGRGFYNCWKGRHPENTTKTLTDFLRWNV